MHAHDVPSYATSSRCGPFTAVQYGRPSVFVVKLISDVVSRCNNKTKIPRKTRRKPMIGRREIYEIVCGLVANDNVLDGRRRWRYLESPLTLNNYCGASDVFVSESFPTRVTNYSSCERFARYRVGHIDDWGVLIVHSVALDRRRQSEIEKMNDRLTWFDCSKYLFFIRFLVFESNTNVVLYTSKSVSTTELHNSTLPTRIKYGVYNQRTHILALNRWCLWDLFIINKPALMNMCAVQ